MFSLTSILNRGEFSRKLIMLCLWSACPLICIVMMVIVCIGAAYIVIHQLLATCSQSVQTWSVWTAYIWRTGSLLHCQLFWCGQTEFSTLSLRLSCIDIWLLFLWNFYNKFWFNKWHCKFYAVMQYKVNIKVVVTNWLNETTTTFLQPFVQDYRVSQYQKKHSPTHIYYVKQ